MLEAHRFADRVRKAMLVVVVDYDVFVAYMSFGGLYLGQKVVQNRSYQRRKLDCTKEWEDLKIVDVEESEYCRLRVVQCMLFL